MSGALVTTRKANEVGDSDDTVASWEYSEGRLTRWTRRYAALREDDGRIANVVEHY